MLQKVLNAPTVSPRSSPPCPPCPEAAAEVRGDEPHLLDVNASDCSRSRLLCSPRFTTKLIDPILATRSLALLDKLQIALKVPSSLLETDKRTSLVGTVPNRTTLGVERGGERRTHWTVRSDRTVEASSRQASLGVGCHR